MAKRLQALGFFGLAMTPDILMGYTAVMRRDLLRILGSVRRTGDEVGHALMKFKDELPKPTLATSGAIGLAFTASAPRTLGSEHPPDFFFGVLTGSQKQRNGGAPLFYGGAQGKPFCGSPKKDKQIQSVLGGTHLSLNQNPANRG